MRRSRSTCVAARMRARTGSSCLGAERPEPAIFEHAQELGLELGRHLGDLVEQERAPARQLELPAHAPIGAGERAALVPEDRATR